MKSYHQHLSALESARLYIKREREEFGFRPDMLEEIDQIAQEMLETIKRLEKQTRETDTLVYKKRRKDGYSVVTEENDFVKIGYIDIYGELVFNELASELTNPTYRFSKDFYTQSDKEFIPFIPKNLILEIVHSHRSNEEFCVVGYIADNQVIYYDQIVE